MDTPLRALARPYALSTLSASSLASGVGDAVGDWRPGDQTILSHCEPACAPSRPQAPDPTPHGRMHWVCVRQGHLLARCPWSSPKALL